jgi:hypothetical protein
MYYAGFREEGYSEVYIRSRKQIDKLCDLIVLGVISLRAARNEYRRIESEFGHDSPEMMDLFKMIYQHRLERLANQFLSEKI